MPQSSPLRHLVHASLIVLTAAGKLAAQEGPVRVERQGPVQVEIEGISGEMRDNVLATLSLVRGPSDVPVSEAGVRRLVARAPGDVRTALEPFGRYESTVRDSVRFDGRGWQVRLEVDPGPPVVVASANVRVLGPGATDPDFEEPPSQALLLLGEPLSHSAYEGLKADLTSAALEKGYLDAGFDSAMIRVDREERTADLVLHFQTGPRYLLGPVIFQQDVLDPDLLQQLVPWQPGAPYDGSMLLSLQAALTEGPYYAGVEIVPRPDLAEDLLVPVEVALIPRRPQRYSAGGGYGTDTGPRVTFDVELRRLNRSGHRAEFNSWIAPIERRAAARYFLPLRRRGAALLTFTAGYVDSRPTTSSTKTWLLGSGLARLWGGWRHDTGLTLQRASFEVGSQSGISTLLLLGTSLSRVRADDRIDPTRGSLVRFQVRGSHERILGDARLLDLSAEGRIVRSPISRIRFLARGEIGALFTPTFEALPGSMRYFAGGDRSVRGFGYQALGPRDADGSVIGGTRLLVGSLEIEARIFEGWGLAGFIDAGNAFSAFSDSLEAGTGVGIRWRSPIGMVRLDGAFAVSRDGSPFRVHVNLGPEL